MERELLKGIFLLESSMSMCAHQSDWLELSGLRVLA